MAHLMSLILEFVQLFCHRFTVKWLVLGDYAYSNIIYLHHHWIDPQVERE